MAAPPLTHHEIITLVAPFARCGRHVDLAASDRVARRIAFKPVERPAEAGGPGALRESLALECLENGAFRLTRSLLAADGRHADLVAVGKDPGLLLGRVEEVGAATQFAHGEGYLLARSFRIETGAAEVMTFTRGEALAGGLRLTLRAAPVRGAPGEIEVVADPADAVNLPEDFFAVQGFAWTHLRRSKSGWTAAVRLRGSGQHRSRDAEARLVQAAAHLARTLAEPPARFHERRVGMRWCIFALRMLPILASVAVISGLMYLQYMSWARGSLAVALILVVPAVLFLIYYLWRDIPGVEKPPLPRRPAATAWRRAGGAG